MNSKIFLTLLCSFLFCQLANAQKNVSVWTKTGKEVSTKDSCYLVRVISMPDSGTKLFNIKEYHKNGKLKMVGKTSRPEIPMMEGQFITYFPSGKKESIGSYKEGYLDGDIYDFFPNGKLYTQKNYQAKGKPLPGASFKPEYVIITSNDSTGKPMVVKGNGHYFGYDEDFVLVEEGELKDGRRDGVWTGANTIKDLDDTTNVEHFTFSEKYDKGTLISGESVGTDGIIARYTNRYDEPTFKGGAASFGDFLSNNIVYPIDARRNNIQGRVYLGFVVEKDGSLTNIKVVRNPNDELTAEALRVLRDSPKWNTGKYYGRPARVSYTIPIAFALSGED